MVGLTSFDPIRIKLRTLSNSGLKGRFCQPRPKAWETIRIKSRKLSISGLKGRFYQPRPKAWETMPDIASAP